MTKSFITALICLSFVLLPNTVLGHVNPDVTEGNSGGSLLTRFKVSHGCGGADSYKFVFTMPEGVLNVKPEQTPGYDINMTYRKVDTPGIVHGNNVTETVDTVTWEGVLPDGFFRHYGLSMQLPHVTESTYIKFPVIQYCVNNMTNDWVGDHEDTDSRPAPRILVVAQEMWNDSSE